MMPDLIFPTSPTLGQTYSYQNTVWKWDGNRWVISVGTLAGVSGIQGTAGYNANPFFTIYIPSGTTSLLNIIFPMALPAATYLLKQSSNLNSNFGGNSANSTTNFITLSSSISSMTTTPTLAANNKFIQIFPNIIGVS